VQLRKSERILCLKVAYVFSPLWQTHSDPTSVLAFVISTNGQGLIRVRIAGPKAEHGPIVISSQCERVPMVSRRLDTPVVEKYLQEQTSFAVGGEGVKLVPGSILYGGSRVSYSGTDRNTNVGDAFQDKVKNTMG